MKIKRFKNCLEMMNMLTKAMTKYVQSFPLKTGYTKEIRNRYDGRLRHYATRAIQDLILLAEKLSEKQQTEIFSSANMAPLLRALFSLKSDDIEKRRKRVIGLWKVLFMSEVMSYGYGADLIGNKIMQILVRKSMDTAFEAIYHAILTDEI